jgi:hypothetical protein
MDSLSDPDNKRPINQRRSMWIVVWALAAHQKAFARVNVKDLFSQETLSSASGLRRRKRPASNRQQPICEKRSW